MSDELLHLGAHETLRLVRETHDELEVEVTWRPGGSPPPPHLHPAQDEHFEVRSGHLSAMVDGKDHDLGPGDALEIMGNAGTRKPPLPAMAKALTSYTDVFQLAIGAKQLRPLLAVALRIITLADR